MQGEGKERETEGRGVNEKVATGEDGGWARLSRGSEKHEVSGNEWKNQQDLVINWILGWGSRLRSFQPQNN